MDRRIDIAISVVFILFGIFVILEARTIKTAVSSRIRSARAPSSMAAASIFILGGLVNIAQRVRGWRLFPSHIDSGRRRRGRAGPSRLVPAGGAARAGQPLYVLTLRPVGYLIGTPLYILAGLWILEQRNWLLNIVVGLVFTIFFYLIFAQVLGVWLPVGPFTQLFRDLGWIIL